MRIAKNRKEPYIDCQHEGKDDRKNELLSISLIIHGSTNCSVDGAVDQIPQYKIDDKEYD